MSSELLPCPHCGSDPVLFWKKSQNHFGEAAAFMPDVSESWTVECTVCPSAMIGDNKEAVVATWNRRAPAGEMIRAQVEINSGGGMDRQRHAVFYAGP